MEDDINTLKLKLERIFDKPIVVFPPEWTGIQVTKWLEESAYTFDRIDVNLVCYAAMLGEEDASQ